MARPLTLITDGVPLGVSAEVGHVAVRVHRVLPLPVAAVEVRARVVVLRPARWHDARVLELARDVHRVRVVAHPCAVRRVRRARVVRHQAREHRAAAARLHERVHLARVREETAVVAAHVAHRVHVLEIVYKGGGAYFSIVAHGYSQGTMSVSMRLVSANNEEYEQLQNALRNSMESHNEDEQLRNAIKASLQQEYQTVHPNILETTFHTYNVPGDGDCFYHCIIRALIPGIESEPDYPLRVNTLRGWVGKKLRENKLEFQHFITTDYDQYVTQAMHPRAIWADDVQIIALLQALNEQNEDDRLSLVIFKENYQTVFCGRIDPSAKWIIFLLYDGSHYQLMRPDGIDHFVINKNCLSDKTYRDIESRCPMRKIEKTAPCAESERHNLIF